MRSVMVSAAVSAMLDVTTPSVGDRKHGSETNFRNEGEK